MTPERFQTIVDAYGADPRRWPKTERAAAEAWAAAHRREADAIRAASTDLDTWLDHHAVAPPDPALQQRIVDSAPPPRPSPRPSPRPRAARRTWWWSGAAVAGVGLVGGLAGAFAVSFFVLTGSAPAVHDSSYLTTSFGGSSADWGDE
jgi:hypothetical protein